MGHETGYLAFCCSSTGAVEYDCRLSVAYFEDGIEWELNRSLFEKICGFLGVTQIDLFASRIKHQTSIYASWRRDPHASYVDAFSVNW